MPRPARVIKRGAPKGDHVRFAGGHDRFGLFGGGDQADRDDGHGHRLLDRAGQRHLIVGTDRDLLRDVQPPLETWIASQPISCNAWAKAMLLSTSQPPGAQSVPDTRIVTG